MILLPSGSGTTSATRMTPPSESTIIVCMPAWGEYHVETATKYAVPAMLSALGDRAAKFIVHTDRSDRFGPVLDGRNVEFRPVPKAPSIHSSLTAAHRDALSAASVGDTVAMLNADIMISREAFDVAGNIFTGQSRVIASTGVRSLVRDEPPPVGVSAAELFAWSWRNKHPIVQDLVWGTGRSTLATMLFFEQEGCVVCHCFHLHPFFIKKDRQLDFRGTIDDDLLARYEASEIHVTRDLEIGFVELSPTSKTHPSAGPMTVNSVVQLGRRYTKAHLRNFENMIRIVGTGAVNDDPAKQILRMLQR